MKTISYNEAAFHPDVISLDRGRHMVDTLFGKRVEPAGDTGYSNWVMSDFNVYARYNYQTMEVMFANEKEVAAIYLKETFGDR